MHPSGPLDLLMYVWVTFGFLIFCVPGARRCNSFSSLRGQRENYYSSHSIKFRKMFMAGLKCSLFTFTRHMKKMTSHLIYAPVCHVRSNHSQIFFLFFFFLFFFFLEICTADYL